MRFFIVLFIIVIAASCQYHDNIEDNFYVSKGYADLSRIPLIKPYEIIGGIDNYWLIHFFHYKTEEPWGNRQRVDYFSIGDSVIAIECNNCDYGFETFDKFYFIIIPKNRVEKAFTNERAFNDYLITNNIKLAEKLKPTETYLNWEKGEPLPWPEINKFYETKDQ